MRFPYLLFAAAVYALGFSVNLIATLVNAVRKPPPPGRRYDWHRLLLTIFWGALLEAGLASLAAFLVLRHL